MTAFNPAGEVSGTKGRTIDCASGNSSLCPPTIYKEPHYSFGKLWEMHSYHHSCNHGAKKQIKEMARGVRFHQDHRQRQ